MQVAKKRADVKVIEIGGQQLGPAPIEMGRNEGDKLREIALVRAHRVRRGVLVEAQVIEEVGELIFHSNN